jgi:hypothetical protein
MKLTALLPCLVDVEKLGEEEGELCVFGLIGQSFLYLQFLRCVSNMDKPGVAKLCSVGHTDLAQAGQEDPYTTVTYTTQ